MVVRNAFSTCYLQLFGDWFQISWNRKWAVFKNKLNSFDNHCVCRLCNKYIEKIRFITSFSTLFSYNLWDILSQGFLLLLLPLLLLALIIDIFISMYYLYELHIAYLRVQIAIFHIQWKRIHNLKIAICAFILFHVSLKRGERKECRCLVRMSTLHRICNEGGDHFSNTQGTLYRWKFLLCFTECNPMQQLEVSKVFLLLSIIPYSHGKYNWESIFLKSLYASYKFNPYTDTNGLYMA